MYNIVKIIFILLMLGKNLFCLFIYLMILINLIGFNFILIKMFIFIWCLLKRLIIMRFWRLLMCLVIMLGFIFIVLLRVFVCVMGGRFGLWGCRWMKMKLLSKFYIFVFYWWKLKMSWLIFWYSIEIFGGDVMMFNCFVCW